MNVIHHKTQVISTILLSEKVLIGFLGILTVLVMVFHLAYLTNYPALHGDEAWNSSASWNWLTTGNNFDVIHTGPLDQFGYEWVRRFFIGQAPWVLSFALMGVGIFQARFVSWVFGVILLVLTIIVGSKEYNRLTGFLAALLLSLSPAFLKASHTARQDMMLAVFIMLTYLLIIIAFDKELWWAHFLAGLSISLALDIHLNAVLFFLPVAILYLAHYKLRILKKPGTWLVAVGGVVGIAYFLVLHILPGNGVFFTLESFIFANESTKALFETLDIRQLPATIYNELGIYRFYDNGFDFALIGASLVFLLFRHSYTDRQLLLFIAACFVSFVLFRGRPSSMYAILMYPFFMIAVASAFVSLLAFPIKRIKSQQVFIGMLLFLFVFNSYRHIARPFEQNKDYDYHQITRKIAEVIPADATVMGLPTWWLGLTEYKYRSSLSLIYYNFFNDYTLEEGMQALRPDIIIVDEVLRGAMSSTDFTPVPYWGVPGQDYKNFLSQQGSLVLAFEDPTHGKIEVYAIDWDDQDDE